MIGPDGKLTVKKGIKYFFVCDITKDKKKQTQTSRSVKKTTASLKTIPSSEDNLSDITITVGKTGEAR